MPILTGVFNYPETGLDQIQSAPEAQALWTVIELNNATAQMLATGSIDNLAIYDSLKERELIAPALATDLEASIQPGVGSTILGEESAFTEVTRTVENDQLVLTLCFQTSYEVRRVSSWT